MQIMLIFIVLYPSHKSDHSSVIKLTYFQRYKCLKLAAKKIAITNFQSLTSCCGATNTHGSIIINVFNRADTWLSTLKSSFTHLHHIQSYEDSKMAEKMKLANFDLHRVLQKDQSMELAPGAAHRRSGLTA
ncbi:hypothetical protein GJAV_G00244290 [Gymnothorax javanicus]|nr:hypothetical protein GJAV_G00244290 [Gymnothorax javanicus]